MNRITITQPLIVTVIINAIIVRGPVMQQTIAHVITVTIIVQDPVVHPASLLNTMRGGINIIHPLST